MNKLFIISGSSGVGKGTVLKGFLDRNPHFMLSISCTTRAPRQGEVDGINYFCDPTYELGFRGGSAFLYFGCTTYDRANDDYAESVIIIGRYSSLTPKDYNISETRIKIIPLS